MSRDEHLQWAKQRALQYVEANELQTAFTSLMSDLHKHEETANHSGIELGAMLLLAGQLRTPDEMRNFIEGFN